MAKWPKQLKKNPTGNFAAMHPSKTYAFSKKLNFSKQNKTIAYFYNFIRVRKHSYSLKKISL
jgi:hypothetical protein